MEIKPYSKNAKQHPKKQIEQIANSIKEFGMNQPIVVDKDGVIIVGHGRYEALQQLGWEIKPEWVIKKEDLTDEQVKAYRLADNKLNESEWDMGLAIEELKGLSEEMFDLTGFDKDLLIEPDEKDDEIPENVPSKSKLGDLYELGQHRVLCGSSTDINDITRLMDNKNAELLFTSPPYSDMRDYNGNKDLSVENLAQFIGLYYPFVNFQVVNLGIQRKEGEIYSYWDKYIESGKKSGYKLLSWNIWEQDGAGSIGKQTAFFPIEHEWLFVFGKFFKEINRTEMRDQKRKRTYSAHRNRDGSMEKHNVGRQESFKEMGSIIYVPSEKSTIRKEHPATFPVELAEKYVLCMTLPTDNVVEPFAGAGSVLIACEKIGRNSFNMELDPKYIDVIVQRYVDYTGNENIKLNGEEIIWKKSDKTDK